MIFGKNAGLMLKYQKAKAKMVEYDVSKQEYPHFPLNSNELSYPTTYVLSRYSECIIENNHDELKELELLLITTAEYYDSAFKSKVIQEKIIYSLISIYNSQIWQIHSTQKIIIEIRQQFLRRSLLIN